MDFEPTAEQKKWQDRAREFTQEVLIPNQHKYPKLADDWTLEQRKEVRKMYRDAGLTHLYLPKKYGGQELDFVTQFFIETEIAKSNMGGMDFFNRSEPFPVMFEGTDYQKKKYLEPLLKDEQIFAFAFTEPQSGSDFQGQQTTAVKQGDNYVLNGKKIFCTHAHFADFTFVCAYTDKSKGSRGMSMFYIDKGTPGWEVERMLPLINDCDLEPLMKLENCVVPAKNMIGEGQGMGVAMSRFNEARMLVAYIAYGKAEASLQMGIEYAKKRQAFGKPIGKFQAIQWKLAEAKMAVESMKWLCLHTNWKWNHGQDVRLDVAMCKAFCLENGLKVIDEMMQIHGGIGLSADYPFYDWWCVLRTCKSAEGTMEITRHIMATEMLGREITHLRD